jgi:hypothetical protein
MGKSARGNERKELWRGKEEREWEEKEKEEEG